MTVVAFVPAKSTSERIENKNKYALGSDPLFIRKLKQLLACPIIDEVWLDTDSKDFAAMASKLPVKIMLRDPALATNSTDGHKLFSNEVEQVKEYATIVIQALCTAPFLESERMNAAIQQLSASDATSLIAVQAKKMYTWNSTGPNYGYGGIPNSVDLPTTIVETMSFYAVKRKIFHEAKRFSSSPIFFELNAIESMDINDRDDLELANSIQQGMDLKNRNRFDILKNKLSSAILGDTAKEMGLSDIYLPSDLTIRCGRKLMGYARPLKLRLLTEEEKNDTESWRGIYRGLEHYHYSQPGDILVIENKTGFAYFGDLNCRVAMSKGVNGAIVEGASRDIEAVSNLGFSVASERIWSNDVKYEATIDTINEPISIGGVKIAPDDLVFSDYQGTICIPGPQAEMIIEGSLHGLTLENKIENEILLGNDVASAIDKHGVF